MALDLRCKIRKCAAISGRGCCITYFKQSFRRVSVGTAQAERTRGIVAYDDVRIDVIAEGTGPLVVLLPSRGRGSEDFDDIAAGIASAGFHVLRPQPRGAGVSIGPMKGLTLHDFARDLAAVIRHEGGGPAIIAGHAFGNWVARMTAVDYPQTRSRRRDRCSSREGLSDWFRGRNGTVRGSEKSR